MVDRKLFFEILVDNLDKVVSIVADVAWYLAELQSRIGTNEFDSTIKELEKIADDIIKVSSRLHKKEVSEENAE